MSTIPLFNLPVATIFAREFLEAAIIIGNYRAIILTSNDFKENRAEALKCVNRSYIYATLIAILVVVAVALSIGLVSGQINDEVIDVIEGVSKVIAAFLIANCHSRFLCGYNITPKRRRISL